METSRLVIVYFHLIACCVAIGLVLTSDVAMVKQLLQRSVPAVADNEHLETLQRTVSRALAVLWATGVGIVALDASTKGWGYFENPKLQAKIGLVVLLTLNGVVLHRTVLPLMKEVGSLLNLEFNHLVLALFAGSVSAVTWFYAALMGVGRSLSWKYSLVELLAAYPVLIGGGFCMMLSLSAWARFKPSRNTSYDFGDTVMLVRL
jgi:hypothetical protein